MKTKYISNIITAVSVSILLFSCSSERIKEVVPEEVRSRFSVDTRNSDYPVSVGTTYRIMAYNGDKNPNEFKYSKTGTYWLKELPVEGGIAELTPCKLNDNGEYISDSSTDGLDGLNSRYYLVFVSPGIKNNDDGSFSICAKTDRFVASELPEVKRLGTYGHIIMSYKMKEYRALLGFNFYKLNNEAVNEFTISELMIIGAGDTDEKVKLFPASRQVVASAEGAIGITLTPVTGSNETDSKGNPQYYRTDDKDMASIVPAIYTPKNNIAKILNTTGVDNLADSDYLMMRCKLQQSGRDGVAVELPLTLQNPEIKPQNKYIYNIIVSSNYINLSVDIYPDTGNDWENGGSEGSTIGPSNTIPLGTWEIVSTSDGNGWELKRLPEQTIE